MTRPNARRAPLRVTRPLANVDSAKAAVDVYLLHTLTWPEELQTCGTKSGSEKLEDGRKVKFTYEENFRKDGAFITAQIERNEVVYSVVLVKAQNPLSHEDVESHFKGELAKKYYL